MSAAIRRYLQNVSAAWNRFWFTPADPATLSAIRICAGLMLLYTHFVWTLDLEAFFGPHSWISADVIAQAKEEAAGELILDTRFWSYFWWLGDRPTLLWAVHLVGLAIFAMLVLGLKTRVVAVLAYLAAVAYVHRTPAAFFGLDKINCMLAMYLMIGPAGAYWSLDRWRAQRRAGGTLPPPDPSVSANITIRLIQVHMCVIYLFSGVDKLQGTTWWDGTAVWLSLSNLEYQSLDMTWLADWPKLVGFMTHAAVFWEVFYCVLVWNRLARPIVLAMAVLVHGGIAIALGMITFGLVMLIGNMAFLSPELVKSAVNTVSNRGRAGE